MLRSYRLLKAYITVDNINCFLQDLIKCEFIYVHVNNVINIVTVDNMVDVYNLLNMCYNWLQHKDNHVKIIADTLQFDLISQKNVRDILDCIK